MCRILRYVCSAIGFVPLCFANQSAHAVFRVWDPVGVSFDWHTAANWDPDGVPTTNDEVQISFSGLQPLLTADTDPVNRLLITRGTLQTIEHTLNVDNGGNGLLEIDGIGGSATVRLHPTIDGDPALIADVIDIGSDGALALASGNVSAEVDESLTIGNGGFLSTSGAGMKTIRFDNSGVVALINNGTIRVGGGTTTLTGGVPNVSLDLDGNVNESSNLVEVGSGATLVIEAGLADPFGGDLFIGEGGELAVLDMDQSTPWFTEASGGIVLDNGELKGAVLTSNGFINGNGTITAPVINNHFISAVDGTLEIRIRNGTDLDGTSNDGELVASAGDLEVTGGGNFIRFAGVLRVSNGQEFRTPDRAFLLDSGGEARLGSTGGLIVGPELRFEAGSLIFVGCCGEGEARLKVENGGGFSSSVIAGEVVLQQDLRLDGFWLIDSTSTISGNGALKIDPTGTVQTLSDLTIASEVINEGLLRISSVADAGELQIDDGYSQTETGELFINIRNVVPGEFDKLNVGGNVSLAGTLEIRLLNDFEPLLGNTFTFLTSQFGIVTGEFDLEEFPIFNGLTFEVLYPEPLDLDQSVVLQVVEAGIPGDYNQDGVVNAADYVVWRNRLGEGASLPNDDTVGVGQDDYDRWVANFGSTADGSSINTTVPEPACATMTICFAIVLLCGVIWRKQVSKHGSALLPPDNLVGSLP